MSGLYSALHRWSVLHKASRRFVTERSAAFRLVYGLVRRVSGSVSVRRGGAECVVPIRRGVGLYNLADSYEPWLEGVVARALDPEGGVFIDVGANVGQTLLKVVPRFPRVRYVAVEPNESCVRYLADLCEANGFAHVSVVDAALADSCGEAELWVRYPDDILATTTAGFRTYTRYARSLGVRAVTGDSLVRDQGLERVDVIKVDVEGGEAGVVAGFAATLAAFRPYVICEVLPVRTEDAGVTRRRTEAAGRLLAMLGDLGYSVHNVHTGATVQGVDGLSDSLESSNYLFVPDGRPNVLPPPPPPR